MQRQLKVATGHYTDEPIRRGASYRTCACPEQRSFPRLVMISDDAA